MRSNKEVQIFWLRIEIFCLFIVSWVKCEEVWCFLWKFNVRQPRLSNSAARQLQESARLFQTDACTKFGTIHFTGVSNAFSYSLACFQLQFLYFSYDNMSTNLLSSFSSSFGPYDDTIDLPDSPQSEHDHLVFRPTLSSPGNGSRLVAPVLEKSLVSGMTWKDRLTEAKPFTHSPTAVDLEV